MVQQVYRKALKALFVIREVGSPAESPVGLSYTSFSHRSFPYEGYAV